MAKMLSSETGSAILVTLLLVLMFSAIGLMSIRRSGTDVNLSFNKVRKDQAFQLADAGLARAMVSLNADSAWRTGYAGQSYGNGVFSATVSDSSSGLMGDDTLLVEVSGLIIGDPSSLVELEAWLVPVRHKPIKYAIYAYDRLRMKEFGCTDSYNSDSGSYAATQLDGGAPVGSNNELRLRDDVVISGDVVVPAPDELEIEGSVTVGGDVITNADPVSPITVPASEFSWAQSVNGAPAGFTGSGYSYVGDDLSINANDTLRLASGVYYFNNIDINANGSIQIEPGAQVTIYATGNIEMRDYASFNPGGAASNMIIFTDAGRLRMEDNTEFRGAYIGAKARFRMKGSANVYGSIMVEREEIEPLVPTPGIGGCFHFDRSLLKFQRGAIETYRKIAWREK